MYYPYRFPQYWYDGPLTSSRWAGVATVTLLVGEAKTTFQVHEAALFEASSFFKAAFTSMFRESSERTMTLPEDDESVFESFVDWLYHGRYDIPRRSEVAEIFLRPVQLFVLADKYGVPDLKSLVLDQMFKLIKWTASRPSLDTVAYAYGHTFQNAAIRKLLVDDMVWNRYHSYYQEAENQVWLRAHPEISTDLNVRFAKRAGRQDNPFDGEMPKEYLVEGPEEDTDGDKEPLSGS